MTLISATRMPNDVWVEAEGTFGERELANLLMAAVAINAWNKIAVVARMASRHASQ